MKSPEIVKLDKSPFYFEKFCAIGKKNFPKQLQDPCIQKIMLGEPKQAAYSMDSNFGSMKSHFFSLDSNF